MRAAVTRARTTLSTVTAAERKSWSKVKGQQGRSGNISDGKCSKMKGRSGNIPGREDDITVNVRSGDIMDSLN